MCEAKLALRYAQPHAIALFDTRFMAASGIQRDMVAFRCKRVAFGRCLEASPSRRVAFRSYGGAMRHLVLMLIGLLGIACGGDDNNAGSRTEGQLPGDCTDGADNDLDGLFDCADSGCSGAPACVGGTDAKVADGSAGNDGSASKDGSAAQDGAIQPDAGADATVGTLCSLAGKEYDPFSTGNGPTCPEGQTSNECYPGDRCETGVCVAVASGTKEVDCAWLGRTYDPHSTGNGPSCPAGQFSNECLKGDVCTGSTCTIVLSAQEESPNLSLLNVAYDPFSTGNGPTCPEGQFSTECFPGDTCDEGVCYAVRSAAGDAPSPELMGKSYDPYSTGNGPTCPTEQFSNECFKGDVCEADGSCTFVLSAREAPFHNQLATMLYDPFSTGNGPACPKEQYSTECYPGDVCTAEGRCAIVKSALGGKLNAALLGQTYDPSATGNGPTCPKEQYSNECLKGDTCVGSSCTVVLSAVDR